VGTLDSEDHLMGIRGVNDLEEVFSPGSEDSINRDELAN